MAAMFLVNKTIYLYIYLSIYLITKISLRLIKQQRHYRDTFFQVILEY